MTLSGNNSTLSNQKTYTMLHNSQQNCVIVSPNNQQSTGMQNGKCSVIIQSHKRPLAPAPSENIRIVNNNIANNQVDSKICKRKINFNSHMSPYGGPTHQPASVARRNARERNRVKQVNNGFATLRQHIPPSVTSALTNGSGNGRGASKKLSKVETLRLAVEYIRSLQQMIEDHEAETSSTNSSCISSSSTNVSMTDNLMESYYTTSTNQDTIHHYQTNLENLDHLGHAAMILQQSPPCSEASQSPTPSFSSESSVSTTPTYALLTTFQTEQYENYEPMSPEDEELLDVISMWQQQ